MTEPNIYRFAWGAYSDRGDSWHTHELKMTGVEVVELLLATWRDKLPELKEAIGIACKVKYQAQASWALFEAAGFVELDALTVRTDGISEYGNGTIDEQDFEEEWDECSQRIELELEKMLQAEIRYAKANSGELTGVKP
jgi:hypothetical protein